MPTKTRRTRSYGGAVAALLTRGRPGDAASDKPWRGEPLEDYGALGLMREDVPELARMAVDASLMDAPDERFFGAVHACRALAQIQGAEALPALIQALRRSVDRWYDHWSEDLLDVLSGLGESALRGLGCVMRDQRESFGVRVTVAEAIERIGAADPGARDRAIGIFEGVLAYARYNDLGINGSVIGSLAELLAAESLPAIRRAFEMDVVDRTCCGTLETVEAEITMAPQERERMREEQRRRWREEWKEMEQARGDAARLEPS